MTTFARNAGYIPQHDQDDIVQELLIILWQCVVHYDPDRGASFNTFFQQSARNRLITLVRKFQTKGRAGTTVSLDEVEVARAVDRYLSVASAEELGLLRIEIAQYVDRFGVGVLSGDSAREVRREDQRSA